MRMIAGRRLLTHQRQLVHTSLAVTAILVVRFQSTPIAFSVPRMQQPALIEPEQCEEVAFDCWERAHVDENISSDEFAKARTVFGYGSLIFRPGFPYKRMYPACVRGYLRRFWQMSCDHRGTPESPGHLHSCTSFLSVAQAVGSCCIHLEHQPCPKPDRSCSGLVEDAGASPFAHCISYSCAFRLLIKLATFWHC